MIDYKAKLLESLNIESLVHTVSDLIKIPSINPKDSADAKRLGITPGEGELSQSILERLRSKNIEAWLVDIEPNRPNLIARYPSGECKGPILAYNAHTDTIGAYDMGEGAFNPVVCGGRLYGRGAADMKGALGCFILALENIASLKVPLKGQLYLTAVIGEEGPPSGSKHLVTHGFSPDGVIVGEASDCQMFNGQRGGQFVRLKTYGKTGHGSIPDSGINAINHMVNLLNRIPKMNIFQERNPSFGPPTCTIGTINGGIRTNVIPDCCEATLDIRFPPGYLPNEILSSFTKEMENMSIEGDALPEEVGHPAYLTNPESKVVDAVRNSLSDLNINPDFRLAPFWTDMAHFVKAGIPSLILGPGSILQAHSGNEYVELYQLELAAKIYMLSALNFCEVEA